MLKVAKFTLSLIFLPLIIIYQICKPLIHRIIKKNIIPNTSNTQQQSAIKESAKIHQLQDIKTTSTDTNAQGNEKVVTNEHIDNLNNANLSQKQEEHLIDQNIVKNKTNTQQQVAIKELAKNDKLQDNKTTSTDTNAQDIKIIIVDESIDNSNSISAFKEKQEKRDHKFVNNETNTQQKLAVEEPAENDQPQEIKTTSTDTNAQDIKIIIVDESIDNSNSISAFKEKQEKRDHKFVNNETNTQQKLAVEEFAKNDQPQEIETTSTDINAQDSEKVVTNNLDTTSITAKDLVDPQKVKCIDATSYSSYDTIKKIYYIYRTFLNKVSLVSEDKFPSKDTHEHVIKNINKYNSCDASAIKDLVDTKNFVYGILERYQLNCFMEKSLNLKDSIELTDTVLGEGEYSKVYLAKLYNNTKDNHQLVAVKVFKNNLYYSIDKLLFQREIIMGLQARENNDYIQTIAAFYDESNNTSQIVMELGDITLSIAIDLFKDKNKKLPSDIIGYAVCQEIENIKKSIKNNIHFVDLHSENALLSFKNKTIKLCDFGQTFLSSDISIENQPVYQSKFITTNITSEKLSNIERKYTDNEKQEILQKYFITKLEKSGVSQKNKNDFIDYYNKQMQTPLDIASNLKSFCIKLNNNEILAVLEGYIQFIKDTFGYRENFIAEAEKLYKENNAEHGS